MGKRSNLTAAELDLIAELTEEAGLSAAQIARRVGCSVGSVTWAQLRIGADRRPTRALPPVPVERKTVMRGNHVVTSYSAEDDAGRSLRRRHRPSAESAEAPQQRARTFDDPSPARGTPRGG